MKIRNIADEEVSGQMFSDAEACRWYLENGRVGDYLDDTGELMSVVVKQVFGFEVEFGPCGTVRVPEGAGA